MADVAMSALSWPSNGQVNGSLRMHVPQFPALNLCERDVRRGAVKVIACSPSGRSQTLKIHADSSGQFTTNFTPNEVGQWIIYKCLVITPTHVSCVCVCFRSIDQIGFMQKY